jgi:hypothetical protein
LEIQIFKFFYSRWYIFIKKALRGAENEDKSLHIDDFNKGTPAMPFNEIRELEKIETSDPVEAIAMKESVLVIARSSGTVLQIGLPALTLDFQYDCFPKISYLNLNANSTVCALTDVSGVFKLLRLSSKTDPEQQVIIINQGRPGRKLRKKRCVGFQMVCRNS